MKTIEQAAVDAHEAGILWPEFIAEHGDRVKAACRGDRGTQRQLTERLLSLVTCGDVDGLVPIPDGYGRPLDHELAELI